MKFIIRKLKTSHPAILIFFLFLSPVLSHAAGQAQWENQVNNAFRQARKSASGLKGPARNTANRYINQAETAWNKLRYNYQPVWYLQQQYQKQNQMNLYFMKQQNMNNLLQQNMKNNLKNLELQTINPFGDYRFHGVSLHPKDGRLHGPGTIADTPALANLFHPPSIGQDALKEADRLANGGKPKKPGKLTADSGGQWDNPISDGGKADDPYKYDSSVVDLRGIKSPTPEILPRTKPDSDGSSTRGINYNPYAEMSDERLEKKGEALKEALRGIQKLSTENAAGYSQIEAGSRDGIKEAGKAVVDAGSTLVFGGNNVLMAKPDGSIPSGALKMANDGADYLIDTANISGSVMDKKWGDATSQAAVTAAKVIFETKNINATPVGGIPGAVKLGLDTGLVWGKYFLHRGELKTRDKTAQQLDDARKKLTKQLNEIIAEQKRRSSYKLP